MRFYSQQHQFYCGIDLHANSMYACVIDDDGTKHLHQNFVARRPIGRSKGEGGSHQQGNRIAATE